MSIPQVCPCGSGLTLKVCCRPLHRGEREAATPTELMRSRFAAFACREPAYLWRTMAAAHRDRALGEREMLRALSAACRRQRFVGLTILDADEPRDGQGRVLFHARIFAGAVEQSFIEASRFVHDGVGWRYLDGEPRLASLARVQGLTLATYDAPPTSATST